MSLVELEKQALALSEADRARLAASLLETLPPDADVSDEEILQRDADLTNGEVGEISHQDLIRRVENQRGR